MSELGSFQIDPELTTRALCTELSLRQSIPRMSAVAVVYLINNTFAERLERAITRSERAKLIEGQVISDD